MDIFRHGCSSVSRHLSAPGSHEPHLSVVPPIATAAPCGKAIATKAKTKPNSTLHTYNMIRDRAVSQCRIAGDTNGAKRYYDAAALMLRDAIAIASETRDNQRKADVMNNMEFILRSLKAGAMASAPTLRGRMPCAARPKQSW